MYALSKIIPVRMSYRGLSWWQWRDRVFAVKGA